jgi:hypothetical protein
MGVAVAGAGYALGGSYRQLTIRAAVLSRGWSKLLKVLLHRVIIASVLVMKLKG